MKLTRTYLKSLIQECITEGKYGTFDWPYYNIVKGELYDIKDKVVQYKGQHKPFKSIEEAEKWLQDHDERGNVQKFVS